MIRLVNGYVVGVIFLLLLQCACGEIPEGDSSQSSGSIQEGTTESANCEEVCQKMESCGLSAVETSRCVGLCEDDLTADQRSCMVAVSCDSVETCESDPESGTGTTPGDDDSQPGEGEESVTCSNGYELGEAVCADPEEGHFVVGCELVSGVLASVRRGCGGDTPRCSMRSAADNSDELDYAKCCPEDKLNVDEDGNCY